VPADVERGFLGASRNVDSERKIGKGELMRNVKTSEGVDKYIGELRLCAVDENGMIDDGGRKAITGQRAAVRFRAADGQELYQIISLDSVEESTRSRVWAKLVILFDNIELKRKRFYLPNGGLVELEDVNV